MRKQMFGTIGLTLLLTALLSIPGGLALARGDRPMKPELAAKKEMVRKQHEQRITPEKRKAAADVLKAQRKKVYDAKKAKEQNSTPQPLDTNSK
ncbi:hypothetical protein [Trichlorobacter lovleyi]|uniref:hypothetical protein n=1 Tax=Trichlorobacter lovleyi TaxID=313985 RepID=UPI003D139943